MKKNFILLIFCGSQIICVAQKRYYTPEAYQISDFDNKGQLAVSGARGNGYDANLSYSLSKNLFVLLSYSRNNRYEKRLTIFSTYGIKSNNNSFSVQFGYYKKIDKPWLHKMELYAGYAKIKIDNYWDFIDAEMPDPATAQYTYGKY